MKAFRRGNKMSKMVLSELSSKVRTTTKGEIIALLNDNLIDI